MWRTAKVGFTLVEILIVLAIIGIMISMLTPAALDALEAGRSAACIKNLGELGKAIEFSASRKGIPRIAEFHEKLQPALGGTYEPFKCPTNYEPNPTRTSYGIHARIHNRGSEDSSQIMALDFAQTLVNPFVPEGEGTAGIEARDDRFGEDPTVSLLRPRHRSTCNVLFGDTHVESMEGPHVFYGPLEGDDLTAVQIETLENEFGTIDVDNLSDAQLDRVKEMKFRERWLFLRDRHFLNEDDEWTGEAIPADVPYTPPTGSTS
ncbi:MAG: type II secretion system protein [Planctomycetota bacterium]|nr:MAG: type II secretion system protein [Planctomycetota bacterium]REK45931.1 MAG: type II secretion system protein [Planctomycetota bacterium]